MRSLNVLRASALAVAAFAGMACSGDRGSSPLAPASTPKAAMQSTGASHALLPEPVLAAALTRKAPLGHSITVSKWIGPRGDSLKIKETGLKMTVPAGAVSQWTLFTVTAIAGDLVAYDFAPHGSTFAVPLEMQQELKGTNLAKPRGRFQKLQLEAGYFKSGDQLNHVDATVMVDEFLPADLDFKANKVKFLVSHFSGYVVSSGRKSTTTSTDW
jgi:hypothetical protein